MQWSEVTKAPSQKHLRQFAGLFLVIFLGMAATRWFGGRHDLTARVLAVAAVVVGVTGLAAPSLVRPIYTGWMIAAFPIGWTVSRLVLLAIFFLVVTPIGLAFRLFGRDALHLRRHTPTTYWTAKPQAKTADYLRQS
ncbi:MAG: SxtJ family membrane protein [Vicinamibacterales bacterium]